MSSAHRPTWEPARAKADVAHISQVQSKYATPTHTRLKFRRPGDTQKRSLQELKAELEAGENRAFVERHPDADMPHAKQPKLITLEEDADDEDLKIPEANDDDDNEVDDEDEDDEDEDDTEALLRELEKVKQERREQQERQEQSAKTQQQFSREEEIARGNPLLNLERALHGDKMPTSSEPLDAPQERWDDDLIFRNQAMNDDNGLSKRGFVNDLTRTEFHKKFMSVRCTMTDHAAIYQVDLYYRTHVEARKKLADVGSVRHGALCRTSDRYVNLALMLGPAGAGKSTFCASLMAHAHSLGRNMHLFNLDPAAERFEYEPTIDIRELISLEDVMEEMDLGPNGGLIYCFDYLLNNLDWLETELGEYDNDYLVIDCPGQIELYTHFPVISRFVELMQQHFHFRVCATYLLDSHFIDDKAKYFAGVLSAMSAMINLDISHLNIMTKMDLVAQHEKNGLSYAQRREIERYMEPDPLLFADQDESLNNARFHALNQAVVQLIEDYSMVSFLPLDLSSEESINLIFSCIDNVVQFGEDEEPMEPKDLENEDANE